MMDITTFISSNQKFKFFWTQIPVKKSKTIGVRRGARTYFSFLFNLEEFILTIVSIILITTPIILKQFNLLLVP